MAQCRSIEVTLVLQDIRDRLQTFHSSFGAFKPCSSPFEVVERWARHAATDDPLVFLGGHRSVKEFIERHPELSCVTVSDCRKRGDYSYGKTVPHEKFAVVNTIYRTK